VPAKVRVEHPHPQRRFTVWQNIKWFLAVSFFALPFSACAGVAVGLVTIPAFSRNSPFSGGTFVVALIGFYLLYAWKSGRMTSWFSDPPRPIILPDISSSTAADEGEDLTKRLYLGASLADDQKTTLPIYLDHTTRNRHVYLIGKTRTGKTSVMKNMIEQDMRAGHGVCFIDPHGDAAEDLAGVVPDDRIDDVIYFDPTSPNAPRFNPLALEFDVAKLAEDIVSVFAMLLGDSWGMRMEHILRFSLMTLIADKRRKHTLADLKTLLLDEAFRGEVLSGIDNQQIMQFWSLEYPTFPAAAPAPILNKLSAFLAPMSDLERVFSHRQNDLDFADIMDNGKLLIITLQKGVLGQLPSQLLGGCLVACIQQSALARAKYPEHKRRPFYLYVDEFQNYTVSSFADILSESAKYKLNLTLAHQNLGQIPDYLRRSLFGNVATLIAYQISAQDAALVAKEMHRANLSIREKSSNRPQPLQDFKREKIQLYMEALQDPMLGMSTQELLRFHSRYQLPSTNPMREALKNQQAVEELRQRTLHIHRALSIFQEDVIDVGALKNLFPDYEFRDTGFPTVEDFVNLPPHHGYIRIGTADNVKPLAPPVPKTPDKKIQQLIFDRRWHTDDKPEIETKITSDGNTDDDFTFGRYDDD